MYEGFDKVTAERWQSLIHKVKEVEDHYWEADGLHEQLVEQLTFTVSENESSDSDDSGDELIDEGVNNEPHLCDSSSSISDSDGASIIIYMSLLFMYVHAAQG